MFSVTRKCVRRGFDFLIRNIEVYTLVKVGISESRSVVDTWKFADVRGKICASTKILDTRES